MTTTTKTKTPAPADPLATLTLDEREALAIVARERAAAIAARRAQQERDEAYAAYYRQRAIDEDRERQEREERRAAAEKAAPALVRRQLGPDDDALDLVRECVTVVGDLGGGHYLARPLRTRAILAAVAAAEAGASELQVMETLGVQDRRAWVSAQHDARFRDPEAELVEALKGSGDA